MTARPGSPQTGMPARSRDVRGAPNNRHSVRRPKGGAMKIDPCRPKYVTVTNHPGAQVYWDTTLTGCWIGVRSLPYPRGAGGACGDACQSTRDDRNPSTAGAPTSPCCSADTASAYRSFGYRGNHHIWRRARSTGRAAMRGGRGRRSDQSVTRTLVRSGRTPARTNSS